MAAATSTGERVPSGTVGVGVAGFSAAKKPNGDALAPARFSPRDKGLDRCGDAVALPPSEATGKSAKLPAVVAAVSAGLALQSLMGCDDDNKSRSPSVMPAAVVLGFSSRASLAANTAAGSGAGCPNCGCNDIKKHHDGERGGGGDKLQEMAKNIQAVVAKSTLIRRVDGDDVGGRRVAGGAVAAWGEIKFLFNTQSHSEEQLEEILAQMCS